MKKYVIVALSVFTLAGCTQGMKTQENPMMGRWACFTNYYDIDIHTQEVIQFDRDGIFVSTGKIIAPISEKPLFVYDSEYYGKWEFKNNELTLMLANSNIVPAHNKETLLKLKKDKKLRETEKALNKALLPDATTTSAKLNILRREKDAVILEQKIDKRVYFSACVQTEALQEKIKNGEIKLNPNF